MSLQKRWVNVHLRLFLPNFSHQRDSPLPYRTLLYVKVFKKNTFLHFKLHLPLLFTPFTWTVTVNVTFFLVTENIPLSLLSLPHAKKGTYFIEGSYYFYWGSNFLNRGSNFSKWEGSNFFLP